MSYTAVESGLIRSDHTQKENERKAVTLIRLLLGGDSDLERERKRRRRE